MKDWQLKETYVGDPKTLQHNNVVGWKPYHVEIGVFVTPNGDKKKEVLDDEQKALEARREYWKEKREQNNDDDELEHWEAVKAA